MAVDIIAGKTVTATWDTKDRSGRILGWIMVDEGIWVNKVMVLTGYAWWFERYAPDIVDLKKAQETAQEKKLGLSAERNAVAPWDWLTECGRFRRPFWLRIGCGNLPANWPLVAIVAMR